MTIDPLTPPHQLAEWARRELLAMEHAKRIAADVGWDPADLPGLIRTALDSYAVERCERGTCAHDACGDVNATVFGPSPFAELGRRAGITFRRDENGGLRAGPPAKITDEWRFFIARNREAILAELTK